MPPRSHLSTGPGELQSAYGRPWTAIDLLAAQLHGNKENPPPSVTREVVVEVLDAALLEDPARSQSQSPGYEVGNLLDFLVSDGLETVQVARYEFAYFRLLENYRAPGALFQTLASNPLEFVDLVQRVYRGKSEPERQLDEHDEAMARHAWWVLAHWSAGFPGQREDGSVDQGELRQWVTSARTAFADSDRADIGDEKIGEVLSRSPEGNDGIWPAEAVRELIEEIGSQSLETGIYLGVYNGQGGTMRGAYVGGEQERERAGRYRRWEQQTAGRWRRTNRLLRGIAESFERDGQRHDDEATIRGDIE